MAFGFGGAQRIRLSEAKRILIRRDAEKCLDAALQAEQIGDYESAKKFLDEAVALEQDAQS